MARHPALGLDPRDPLLAPSTTADPVTEGPFSTQGWNGYSYVGNSPVNFTDPQRLLLHGLLLEVGVPGHRQLLPAELRQLPTVLRMQQQRLTHTDAVTRLNAVA